MPTHWGSDPMPVIAQSLRYIFNKSIETGTFPSGWKRAKATPLYKANEKDLADNYRPISVIPGIVEPIVYYQLYDYLNTNNLPSKYQSGFRLFHPTLYATY